MDHSRALGYLFGMLTAICWASSSILIRKGLVGLPSSLWGVLVGLATATLIWLAWLALRRPQMLRQGWRLDPALRAAICFQVLAGIAAALGTLGRTRSLALAPVVVAIPLSQTTSLFTLIFAPLLLGRSLERVNPRLVLGALCVVAGSALVVIGQQL